MKLVQCIEQIYCCRNKFLVLPQSFRQNLVTYSLSNSKLLVNMNGCTKPAGTYSYMSKWLSDHAQEEIKFPDGLVRFVFDNEQVVGKRYTVKGGSNSVPISVITSYAYLCIDEANDTQCSEHLKPSKWLFGKLDRTQQHILLNSCDNYKEYFRMSRNELISKRLECVMESQKREGDGYSNKIDCLVLEKKDISSTKRCLDCDAANDSTYRNCTNCGGKLKKDKFTISLDDDVCCNNNDPYGHFSIKPKDTDIKVIVGEPDLMNPSGFLNISKILQNIGKRTLIDKYVEGGKRKWLFLDDGSIYHIAVKLIDNVLQCRECKETMYGKTNFDDHPCNVLNSITPEHEFDWIIIMPGLLHLEMNAVKHSCH